MYVYVCAIDGDTSQNTFHVIGNEQKWLPHCKLDNAAPIQHVHVEVTSLGICAKKKTTTTFISCYYYICARKKYRLILNHCQLGRMCCY